MTPCDDFRAQLPLFVGGDLEAPLAAKLQEHLGRSGSGMSSAQAGPTTRAEGCVGCTQVLASLEASRAELLDLPRRSPAPSVDLWGPIRATLTAEGRIATASRRTVDGARSTAVRRATSWWRVASAAAAAALLAIGVQVFVHGSSPSPGIPGDEPAAHTGSGSLAGQIPAGESVALPGGGVIEPVGMGGLRRLEPGEEPLSRDPFLRDFRGLSEWQFGPGTNGLAVDPSHPTLASDRLR